MKHISESIIGRKGNGNSNMFAGSPKTVFHILLFQDNDVDLFKEAAEHIFGATEYIHGKDFVSIWKFDTYKNTEHISGGVVNARGEDLARIHIGKPIECRIYKTTFENVSLINKSTSINMANGDFDPDEYYNRHSFTLIYSGKKIFLKMKHISESIIGRKGVNVWPNPYGLTQKDAKRQIEGYPLEIITLALYETYLVRDDFGLENLQKIGLHGAFIWDDTKDGYKFWNSIAHGEFDVFYDIYTPEKLRERLKEK